MKYHLIGSTPSKESMTKRIGEYYYSPNIKLIPVDEKTFDVHNSKGKIDKVRVIIKKKRYRFERELFESEI